MLKTIPKFGSEKDQKCCGKIVWIGWRAGVMDENVELCTVPRLTFIVTVPD